MLVWLVRVRTRDSVRINDMVRISTLLGSCYGHGRFRVGL